jgi:hypothetical protein
VRDCQEILRARFLDHKIIDPTILWPSTQTRRVQFVFRDVDLSFTMRDGLDERDQQSAARV